MASLPQHLKIFLPHEPLQRPRESQTHREQIFPHHVDMMVPEGGLGDRLNAMHAWHHA